MADSVVLGTGNADTVSFLKSTTGVVYDAGLGNDAITGSSKDDVIRGGGGADRIMGGAGNDSFVIVAGDLISSYASNNGQNGLIDHIIDFQGAGSNAGSGFQDKLVLYGFSADSTITFEKYVSDYVTVDGVKSLVPNQAKQVYKITDPNDHSKDGFIVIQMADGNSKLTADDFVFKADKIGGVTTGDVTEAGFDVPGNPDAQGKVTAELFDQNTTFKPASAEALAGKYGSFTFDADGNWTYHLDNSLEATQALGRSDTVTETLKVQTVDGTYAEITVTVHGTNDAPVVNGSGSALVNEGSGSHSIDALAFASDVDFADTLSVIAPELPPGVTYDAATHSFVLNTNHADYNELGRDESVDVVVNYKVSDGLASTNASVKFTVHGTNDAPVVSAINASTVDEKHAPVVLNLLAGQTDPDTHDTLSAINVTVTDNLGHAVGFTSNGDGTITIDPAQYGSLNDGESRTLTVNYEVSDGLAHIANTASLKITGITDYDENHDADATASGFQFIFDNNNPNILRGSHYGDVIAGNGGNDTIYGGAGDDILDGGNGIDTIWGGSGCDLITGSNGNDRLYGGSGNDILKGELGNDILDGGTGNDSLTGGLGADTFVFRANSGQDTIWDFGGGDKIQLLGLGITDANFASHVQIVQHFGYADVILDGNPANTITVVSFGAIDKTDFLFA